MDYGKFKYESAMKARDARKNQAHTVIKEMKLRPKIDPHDYETKKGHVVRFLAQGDKVKITIMFRGREQTRPELGFRLLQRLADDVQELGFVESRPKQDGRNMIMVLGPHKKKAEAKAERAAAGARRGSDPAASRQQPAEAATATATATTAPVHRPRPTLSATREEGDAEEQDAQRCEEAVPDHRRRQGDARAGQPPPPVREEVLAARRLWSWTSSLSPADRKKAKRMLGV